MPKRLSLEGTRFGRLLVKEYLGKSTWLCQCDCGNIVNVRTCKLRTGNTKSCKCLRNTLLAKERTLEFGYAAFREVVRSYKRGAKERGYQFNLTEDECKNLMESNCFYCDSPPSQTKKHKECYGEFTYNGIDRIDNMKGYTKDNCVSCCKNCNYAKRSLTLKEFADWINKIHKRMEYWNGKRDLISN